MSDQTTFKAPGAGPFPFRFGPVVRAVAVVVVLGIATRCGAEELLENGDFAKDLPSWRVHLHNGYVPTPTVEIGDHTFDATGLRELTHHYFSLAQAVEIKKGTRYTIRYEVRGPATGSYRVLIGDSGEGPEKPTWHYASKKQTPGTDWELVEAEFVGTFDTDSKWYRKTRKNARDNELIQGRTPRVKRDDRPEVDPKDLPCRSMLHFILGALEGEFHLRNVSLVEVTN